jgi:cytochrome c peroxidase
VKRKWIAVPALFSLVLFSIGASKKDNTPDPYSLNYPVAFGNRFTISADNPLTKEGVHLGRLLFYEEKLSSNNTLSCASCHQQKLAFTDGKQFSEGVDKSLTRRNSMSLSNLLWVRNLFWDGRSTSLEQQSIIPLTDIHEMGQPLEISAKKIQNAKAYRPLFQKAFGTTEVTGDLIVKAIAQFERTLISADSKFDQYQMGKYTPTASELEGMSLFTSMPSPEKNIRGANCVHCHALPKTFSELFHNNGLDSIAEDRGREDATQQPGDRGRFRVPTLRNISVTGPYMHDGRFKTLNEVVDHYNEHIKASETLSAFVAGISNEPGGKKLSLTSAEKKSLVSFLQMLTDSTFISNPAFSDPHNLMADQ